MPSSQSLDELIAKKAVEFADQLRAAAAMADKEEEIRIEAEKQLGVHSERSRHQARRRARVHRCQRPGRFRLQARYH